MTTFRRFLGILSVFSSFTRQSGRTISRCRGETDDVSGLVREYGYAFSDLLACGFLGVSQADKGEPVSAPLVAEPIVVVVSFETVI